MKDTSALLPVLELLTTDEQDRWLYETPSGGHVLIVFNKIADGFVAHRSNDSGTWLGPRLVGGHGKGRGLVLDELEQMMEAGRL